MDELRRAGLQAVRMDGVGNVYGRYGPADAPVLMCGSHLDSVPEGGCFDGVLGVVAALECVRALRDAGVRPEDLGIAVEVVATAEEEGRFGGMLGSQAIAGLVDPGWLDRSCDADGVTLREAMRAQGLRHESAITGECLRAGGTGPGQVAAFVELHVEQGPVLEQAGLLAGVVTSISGTANPIFTLRGESNHSGTTPMDLRRDAVAGFCEIGAALPHLLAAHGSPDARVTIGKVDVEPNFPHTVAGEVRFAVNVRDSDASSMRAIEHALEDTARVVALRHGLDVEVDRRLGRLAPVQLDEQLGRILADEARGFLAITGEPGGKRWQAMPSGAGHDAQNMQAVCPAAMLFVPSRGGVSHAPHEFTEETQVAMGVQLLCNFVHRVCVADPELLLRHPRHHGARAARL